MTTRHRSERSRWVQVYYLPVPQESSSLAWTVRNYEQARAVVQAFEKVGRVVRVEVVAGALIFRARKA
jgi:hypothetical protein